MDSGERAGRGECPAEHIDVLHRALRRNAALYDMLCACEGLRLAQQYVGAGCIAQTVWNAQLGNDPMYGISDVDFVYFDPDVSYEAEDRVIRAVNVRFAGFPLRIDIKNQARVHLWYAKRFGEQMTPYTSSEHAISNWPTTATAAGVRLESDRLHVRAPFGLEDMLGQIVRPNKAQTSRTVYEQKAARWKAMWPSLRVVGWEEA